MANATLLDFLQKTLKAKIPKDSSSNQDILAHLAEIQALEEDTSPTVHRGEYHEFLQWTNLESGASSS